MTKQKSIIWRVLAILLVAFIWGGNLEAYAEKPWVKYDWSEGTLTFYYTKKAKLGEWEYDLNSGENEPEWLGRYIIKVVFDKSFADARPGTCYSWFCNRNIRTIEGIENLNTSEVTNMHSMFNGYGGTSLDLSNFDTSIVTDMGCMFADCKNLTSLDLANFNTSKVTDMGGMFMNCESLTSLDVSNFNTSKVTGMSGMFSYTGLKELDISSFNTANVRAMASMFYGCESLTTIYASDKFVTTKVKNEYDHDMFSDCTSLKGDISCDGENYTDKTYAKTNGGYFTDAAKYTIPWVKYDGGTLSFRYSVKRVFGAGKEFKLNDDNVIPGWLRSSVAPNITKVVFYEAFAEVRPTTCYCWFNGLENLKTIKGIKYLNTSEVTDMYRMFKGCSSLASLDVSNFNTDKVKGATTSMYEMFRGCSSLKSLNLTSFNIQEKEQEALNMNYMFKDCSQLKTIYIGEKFDTGNVSVWEAFNNCPAYLCCQPYQYAAVRAKNNNTYSPVYYRIRPYVEIKANAPFGTLCVPFGSTLTEGNHTGFDKIYRVKGADADKCTITLEETTTIEPGVAYIYRRDLPEDATESIITFTVDDTKTSVSAPQNDNSLLKGTFQRIYAPKGSYILLSDGNFHPVADGYILSNPVRAYRAYLDLSQTTSGAASTAQTYRMVLVDGEVTGIGGISDNGNLTDQPTTIYDLSGRRVNVPQNGGIYIVNGKKVMYNK